MSRPRKQKTMTTQTEALRIEGEMTIYRAAELKQRLADWQGGAIDLSAVTEIDCSGIQLLALAQRAAAAAGRELRLAGPSPQVAEVFHLLNFGPCLGGGA
jgi:anti-sigma B factor antagonist